MSKLNAPVHGLVHIVVQTISCPFFSFSLFDDSSLHLCCVTGAQCRAVQAAVVAFSAADRMAGIGGRGHVELYSRRADLRVCFPSRAILVRLRSSLCARESETFIALTGPNLLATAYRRDVGY